MDYRIYAFDYPSLLSSLAQTQPLVFLDVFLGGDHLDDSQRRRMFHSAFEMHDNPINQIPDDEILSWC